jgi:hypothetical protein
VPVYGSATNKTAVAMGRETRVVEGDRGVIIYIAGKIAGDPEYKKKFADAEDALWRKYPDAYIFNPATLPEGLTSDWYIDMCQLMIKKSDVVYFLPDWPLSKGAQLEMRYCNYIGVKIDFLYEVDFSKKEPLRNGNSESGKSNINKYNLAF